MAWASEMAAGPESPDKALVMAMEAHSSALVKSSLPGAAGAANPCPALGCFECVMPSRPLRVCACQGPVIARRQLLVSGARIIVLCHLRAESLTEIEDIFGY